MITKPCVSRIAVIVSLISSFSYGAITTNSLEVALRTIRSRDITLSDLGSLYLERTNAPTAEISSTVSLICAAGLLYLGEIERYRGAIRESIPQVEAFERALITPCQQCNQTGQTALNCTTCKGNGRCKVSNCRNGFFVLQGFDGRAERRQCMTCRGSGRCNDCGGTGKSVQRCRSCNGLGGTFTRSLALAEYQRKLESTINYFDESRRLHQEQFAQQQFLQEQRRVQIETQREAQLVEARALGEERARQAALIEREALQRQLQEAEDTELAQFDRDYLRSVVIIEGDKGVGTGFLCEFEGQKLLFSNAHVLLGNREIRLRTLSGDDLEYTSVHVCRDRDIVAYELASTEGLSFLSVHTNMSEITNQERVVVFGNSAGGGVVTTLRGQMQGIGPDKIEVDATFVQGNSGSPIIAYPYNAVVGMATYAKREPSVDWVNRSTRFEEVRRFGVRLDNISWDDFFALEDVEYHRALDIFDEIIAFATGELRKAHVQGRRYSTTDETRNRARALLEKYQSTPEWMRKYAEEAQLSAFVCTIILK